MKNKNVPKLRFKGFSDEWTKHKLSNLVEVSKEKYNPIKSNMIYKCVELEHITPVDGRLIGYVNSNDQTSIKNKFNVGDVLFGKLRPYLKKYWKANFEGVCSSEILVLKGKLACNNFLYNLIQSNKFNEIANISSGSKMPRADWNYMSTNIFSIPTLQEQERIANFLSNVDKIIETQDLKVKDLELYKKGMMQKLFKREIRFKDINGEEYPKWEEKKLGSISEINKGIQLNKENFIPNGKYYVLNGGTIPSGFTDKYNTNQNTISISEGGNSCGFVNYNIDCFWSGGHCYTLNIKDNKLCTQYIFQNLKYNERHIMNLRVGTGLPNIQKKSLTNFKINIPCLEEQEKIANCLSNIDNVIEEEKKKLEDLRLWKKGLLQQMFV